MQATSATASDVDSPTDFWTVYLKGVSKDDLESLKAALYPELPHPLRVGFALTIFLRSLIPPDDKGARKVPTLKQSIDHIHCLADFLHAQGGVAAKVDDFRVLARNRFTGENAGWPVLSKEFKYAWELLYEALGFHLGCSQFSETFGAMVKTFFPQTRRHCDSFGFSLQDLASVDLPIQPTELLNDHLQVYKGKVKVLTVSGDNMHRLYYYKYNKVACALGIESLGKEVLGSITALIGDDRMLREPETQRLIAHERLSDKELQLFIGQLGLPHHPPLLLAERTLAIQDLIRSRRRWWNSLYRDIRRQRESQPFIFYGALLAVFFGVCTFIQTVCSVWSVVLAYRQ